MDFNLKHSVIKEDEVTLLHQRKAEIITITIDPEMAIGENNRLTLTYDQFLELMDIVETSKTDPEEMVLEQGTSDSIEVPLELIIGTPGEQKNN